jgi:hypothetical protein
MHKGVGSLLALCFLPVASLMLVGQQDTPEALEKRATQAYQARDYATFLSLEKQLQLLNPNDPRPSYNVACGNALLNRPAEAIQPLEDLLARHLDMGAELDPDFAAIRKSPQWASYVTHLGNLRKPLIHSSIAFTIPERSLMASGVVMDERSGDAYVGSMRARKIVKRSKDGTISDFAADKDGLFSVTSLLLDPIRNQLFAGTSALPFMQGFRKEDEGRANICVFDLPTGKLIRTATIGSPGEHHRLSQIAEDRNGNVFVLDAGSAEIHRLRRSSSEMEFFRCVSGAAWHCAVCRREVDVCE